MDQAIYMIVLGLQTYSVGLASVAQEWAEQCTWAHGMNVQSVYLSSLSMIWSLLKQDKY